MKRAVLFAGALLVGGTAVAGIQTFRTGESATRVGLGTPVAVAVSEGAVWVFRRAAEEAWTEEDILRAPDAMVQDLLGLTAPGLTQRNQFDADIEVQMGHIMVGAPGANGSTWRST